MHLRHELGQAVELHLVAQVRDDLRRIARGEPSTAPAPVTPDSSPDDAPTAVLAAVFFAATTYLSFVANDRAQPMDDAASVPTRRVPLSSSACVP